MLTPSQAINWLNEMRSAYYNRYGNEDEPTQAYEMAVEAIKDKENNWERKYWDLAKSIGHSYEYDLMVPKSFHDKAYELLQKRYFELLKRTGWIPVEQDFPPDKTSVLVYHSITGLITEAWVFGEFGHPYYDGDPGDFFDDVTHWMPLPEPPQEVE